MTLLHTATDGYTADMTDIPVRDLRNDTAGVLRRVESGEDITITVHGQAVAKLVPVDRSRRRPIPWEELTGRIATHAADPGLADDLRLLAGETTADLGPIR